MDNKILFLRNVLGTEEAKALEKSIIRLPDLSSVVVSCAVSSWINTVGDYEGEIPGINKSNFEINKSEDGLYSGKMSVSDFNYEFSKSTLPEVVAVFGMVLGIESYKVAPEIKKVNISELGKNIDSLVKVKCFQIQELAKKELEKSAPPGFSEETMHKLKREHGVESAFKIAWAAYDKAHGKKPMKKDELAAAPALHNTVEGFMGGLKSLPKGSPERGKFITAHMNHGPFLSALKAHPQGKQVHAMLTQHLNGANAAFKPGHTQTIAKSEVDIVEELEKAVPLALARHKILNKPDHVTTNQGGMIQSSPKEVLQGTRNPSLHSPYSAFNRYDPVSGSGYDFGLSREEMASRHQNWLKRNALVRPKNHEKYLGHVDAVAHHGIAAQAARKMSEVAGSPADQAHFAGKAAFHNQMAKLHTAHAAELWSEMPEYKPEYKHHLTLEDISAHKARNYNDVNPMMLIGKNHAFDSKLKSSDPAYNAMTSVRINKSELYNKCDTCGEPEFREAKFTGCLCLRDLAKHETKVIEHNDHYVIEFGKGWDENEDSISTILAILKPEKH